MNRIHPYVLSNGKPATPAEVATLLLPTDLIHTSDEPLSLWPLEHQTTGLKPFGVWVARGASWFQFEEIDGKRAHVYRIHPRADAKLRTLSTVEDAVRLTQDYGRLLYIAGPGITTNWKKGRPCIRCETLTDALEHIKRNEPRRHAHVLSRVKKAGSDERLRFQLVDYLQDRFNIVFPMVFIDWAQMQKKESLDGVIFENYLRTRNALRRRALQDPEHLVSPYIWYDSIDVPSGVIWNTGCIESVELVAKKID